MPEIKVDEEVVQLILKEKTDYRVCTACRGPALVPTSVKPVKFNDVKIPVGDYTLYVSAVQSNYINRVSIDMLYDENDIYTCPALSQLRDMGWIDRK